MFKLSRFLLVIALLEFGVCGINFTAKSWPWPLFIVLGIIILRTIERRKLLWAYGTAQWSGEVELRRKGMVSGTKGLAIGRLTRTEKEPWASTISCLFEKDVSDKEACERSIKRLMQIMLPRRPEIVRLSTSVHTAVFGPTGAGKGASFIIPWLLETDESAIVLDYKGENAAITARHRAKMFGHRVILLDPFRVVTNQPDCLNPVDFIMRDSPTAIDDCRDLGEQLVVRTGEEREPHWNEAAEMWIAAAIVAVVQHAESDNRSLQTVRDVLSNPDKIPQLIELLCKSEGMFARLGGQLAHFRDKELSSTLTTANRHLRFLDTIAVAANTTISSFDPRDLRNGKMTIYCILPPEHMRAQSALVRMWVGTLMRSVVQGGLQQGRNVNVILDEAASLGPNMGCIEDAIDKYRGYGIRLQMYYQSPAQLKKCFPKDQDQTVLANMTQVFFGVNDMSAEYVSNRLGDQTIIVDSGGSGSGYSNQSSGAGGRSSSTHSTNSSQNWSQIARRLLKPDEILSMSERIAITFVPGMRPILTKLERYYEKNGRGWVFSVSDAIVFSAYILMMMTSLLIQFVVYAKGVRHG